MFFTGVISATFMDKEKVIGGIMFAPLSPQSVKVHFLKGQIWPVVFFLHLYILMITKVVFGREFPQKNVAEFGRSYRSMRLCEYAFFFRNCFWWMDYDTANANFSTRVEKNRAKLFKMDFSIATDRSAPYLLLPDFSWKQCGPIWISGNSLTPDRVWPQFEPGSGTVW